MQIYTLLSKLTNPHPDAQTYGPTFTYIGSITSGPNNGWDIYVVCSDTLPINDSNNNNWVQGLPSDILASTGNTADQVGIVPSCNQQAAAVASSCIDECILLSENVDLDFSQQELIAKPTPNESIWRFTSSSPAAHVLNLYILNWLSINPTKRFFFENIPGLPLWWTGNSAQVVSSTATTIDVLNDTTALSGWSGSVDLTENGTSLDCTDIVQNTGLDDELNKATIQSIYDGISIGEVLSGQVIPFTLYELSSITTCNNDDGICLLEDCISTIPTPVNPSCPQPPSCPESYVGIIGDITIDNDTPLNVNVINTVAVDFTPILAILQSIADNTLAIDVDTTHIDNDLHDLITLVTNGNLTLTQIVNSLNNNILPALQAIDANTDQIESQITALTALTQTEFDQTQLILGDILLELQKQEVDLVISSPAPICVDNAGVKTSYYVRELTLFNNITATNVSVTTQYSIDAIVWTNTVPTGTITVGMCTTDLGKVKELWRMSDTVYPVCTSWIISYCLDLDYLIDVDWVFNGNTTTITAIDGSDLASQMTAIDPNGLVWTYNSATEQITTVTTVDPTTLDYSFLDNQGVTPVNDAVASCDDSNNTSPVCSQNCVTKTCFLRFVEIDYSTVTPTITILQDYELDGTTTYIPLGDVVRDDSCGSTLDVENCKDNRRDELLSRILSQLINNGSGGGGIASSVTVSNFPANQNVTITAPSTPHTLATGTGAIPADLRTVTIKWVSGVVSIGSFTLDSTNTSLSLDATEFTGNTSRTLPAIVPTGGTWQWIGLS